MKMDYSRESDFAAETGRVAERVRTLAASCPAGFWFITDLHVPSNHGESGGLLGRLIAETGLKGVVCGGDIPEAFGDRAALDESVVRYRALWVDAVERAGGEFLPLHGNHDLTIRSAPDVDDGFSYPPEKTRSAILDTAAVRARAKIDPGSCAYCADFPEARFRLVAADTHDGFDSTRSWWAVKDSVSESQLLWLAENAFATLPSGWTVAVASHSPLGGVGANDAERKAYAPLLALLEAFQARSRICIGGRDFDFSKSGGTVALALSGHHHAELQSCVGGVWHVTEPCDAAYLDYINRSKPWCDDLPVKERGTWAGQTFDAVQIDPVRGLAHFTRVGGGTDRTLHLSPLRLGVGETATPAAAGASASPLVLRGCYDAARAVARPNPARRYDYFTDYFGTVAEATPGGAVRALAPGEAVAVATTGAGHREYFPVIVE